MSDLTALAKFTSVDLTWSAPQEPNGIIISYEVTYRVGMQQLNRINTTYTSTSFIISSLSPQTTVSGLSVRAYTRIGRGEAATIADHTTLDECELCRVITLGRLQGKHVSGSPSFARCCMYCETSRALHVHYS